MSANDDMLYLQNFNGILDDRQAVEVRVHNHIGNIAVNKDFARWQTSDLVGRNTAVGTPDPEQFGMLLVCEV